MRIIHAKFKSKCANTGKVINKGDLCYYDSVQKQVYSKESIDNPLPGSKAEQLKKQHDAEIESQSMRGYQQAQEDAWYQNQYGY